MVSKRNVSETSSLGLRELAGSSAGTLIFFITSPKSVAKAIENAIFQELVVQGEDSGQAITH
jgi:hypothetical protein